MANIPNVPGVPQLPSYGGGGALLAIADAGVLISALLTPPWGVYVNGSPVITPATVFTQAISGALSAISQIAALVGFPNIIPVTASTAEFEYKARSPISNYPQQKGAFQAYNKVQLPASVTMKLVSSGSASQLQAFFDTLNALRTSTILVDLVTPESVFSSYNCVGFDFRRRAESGVSMIAVDVHFEYVPVTGQVEFSNTKTPGTAGQQGLGNVQPVTPPTSFSDRFSSAGGVT